MSEKMTLTPLEIVRENLLDAQNAALGCVLLEEKTAPAFFRRAREEHFSGVQRDVYRVIDQMHQTGVAIDPVVVSARLVEQGYGAAEVRRLIVGLMDITPTAVNLPLYLDRLEDNAALCRMQELGRELSSAVSVSDAREMVEQMAKAAVKRHAVNVVSARAGYLGFADDMDRTEAHIPWGFRKLTNALMSCKGDFVVLGGRPSAGKTALSLQMAWEQAKFMKVGYFSLETSAKEVYFRLMAMETGVDSGDIRRRTLSEAQWDRIAAASKEFDRRRLEVIEASGMTVQDIRAQTLAGGYDAVYVDYLQIVQQKGASRYEKVTEISTGLHTMALTLGVLVVGLSQLSRPERGGTKPPTLQDLRESGQIEQDAEVVLLLHRVDESDSSSMRTLQVAKNKKGPAGGYIDLNFKGSSQIFWEA